MKTLYLGIDPPQDKEYVHYPIIKTVFREIEPESVQALKKCTHYIFTSKNGIRAVQQQIIPKPTYSVGKQTASLLQNFSEIYIPAEETAEGLVELMKQHHFVDPYFVWPHSSLSRSIIPDYLRSRGFEFHECNAYDTIPNTQTPLPDLNQFEEIIFTSPSTVTTFLNYFGEPPEHIRLTAIGPVTQQSILLNFFKSHTML